MRLVNLFAAFLCVPVGSIHADDSSERVAESKRREFLSSLALITRLDSSFEYQFHDSYVEIPKSLRERLERHWPDFEFSIAEQSAHICWSPDKANALIVQRRTDHNVCAYFIDPIIQNKPASFGLLAEEIVWEYDLRPESNAKEMFRDLEELISLTQGFELTDVAFYDKRYSATMEREIWKGRRKLVRTLLLKVDDTEFVLRERDVMIEDNEQPTENKSE